MLRSRADVADMLRHPVWNRLSNAGFHPCPATCLRHFAEELVMLSSRGMRTALPTLPDTTAGFRNDFITEQDGQGLAMNPARVLQHAARVIPSLQGMDVLSWPASGLRLEAAACTSLQRLSTRHSDHGTGEALLLLATALPGLRVSKVVSCYH